jgi:predicted transcriptional regulator
MKKKVTKEKVLFVRVSEETLKRINALADKEERTQVSICRQAIKEFLKRKEAE